MHAKWVVYRSKLNIIEQEFKYAEKTEFWRMKEEEEMRRTIQVLLHWVSVQFLHNLSCNYRLFSYRLNGNALWKMRSGWKEQQRLRRRTASDAESSLPCVIKLVRALLMVEEAQVAAVLLEAMLVREQMLRNLPGARVTMASLRERTSALGAALPMIAQAQMAASL